VPKINDIKCEIQTINPKKPLAPKNLTNIFKKMNQKTEKK